LAAEDIADVPAEEPLALPDLSPAARAFLTSAHYRESDAALERAFGLTAEDVSFLNEMDHLVLGDALPLDGYVRALRAEFPVLDTATRDTLIARLLADRFLPWGDTIHPSAQAVAAQEKLTLPKTPYYTVYFKPLTYSQAAQEVAKMVDLPLSGQTIDRLRDVLVSRAKGVRLEPQVEAQLMRPIETGGLGLEPERARATVIALNDILTRTHVVADDAPAPSQKPSSAPVSVAASASAAPSPAVVDPLTKEDDEEIAAISARMPTRPPVADALRQSTQAVIARLTWKPKDTYLQRRLENIVSTRMRDVRSRNEVLLTAMRDAKVGGLGIDRAQAEALAAEIEAGYTEFHGAVLQESQAERTAQQAAQAARVEERKRREVEEHAQWFEARVQRPPTQILHPLDAKEQVRERAAFGEMVPTAAGNRPMGAAKMAEALGYTAPTPASIDPHAPAVRISASSVAAADTTPRPRMEDVRPGKPPSGVTGPLQELRSMTLAAFRRLAKTPEASAARVRQMVELVGQESFTRRVEAVRAWQESPLQRQYLTLVAQAFASATPLQTLLAQKKATGEDVLSTAEVNAVVSLNVGL
jgi:hypothetical protein